MCGCGCGGCGGRRGVGWWVGVVLWGGGLWWLFDGLRGCGGGF